LRAPAKRSIASREESWIASSRSLSSGARSRDPLAFRNDGEMQTYFRVLAARCARDLPNTFALMKEGAGNAGRPMHPQKPRARWGVKYATSIHSGGTGKSPGIPHALVLTGYGALPRGPGFFAPVIPQAIAHRCPVGLARLQRNLTPASGCQDHTPWPSASAPFVLHAPTTHG
jgi:hypothetical protein